jgi:hypothetical protein
VSERRFNWVAAWALVATATALACGSSSTPADPSSAPARAALVLGDSLALSPSRSEAFPALLQARIAREGLRYTVLNAGVSGDTTT